MGVLWRSSPVELRAFFARIGHEGADAAPAVGFPRYPDFW